MTMRRVVQASICAAVLWFGVLEFGAGFAGKGEAAEGTSEGAAGAQVSYRVQTRQLLGVRAEASLEQERNNASSGKETTERLGAAGPGGATAAPGRGEAAERGGTRDMPEYGETRDVPERKEMPEADGTSGRGERTGLTEKDARQGQERADHALAGDGAGTADIWGTARDTAKIVYLTFDDGPSKHTPEVLDILKREGVAATFFLLGEHVERNPETVKRIVEEGHAVGNHTYNHVYEQLYSGFDAFAEQIMRTDDAIYEAAGVRTVLVRAPGGTHRNFDQGYFDALKAAGYIVHDWNVDSGDSKRRGVPAAEIVANVKGSKPADTLNVLLHDSVGHEESVKALPEIIRYYKGLGYTFRALDDEVPPMQFSLAPKPKWSRGSVSPGAGAALAAFAESRSERSRLTGNHQPAEPKLIVHHDGNDMELLPDQYTLAQGTVHVPLQEMMEWMGGSYELDEVTGVIGATLRGKELFWIVDSWPPAESDGTAAVKVPIRATLAKFGIEIEDYIFTKERREIWVQSQ